MSSEPPYIRFDLDAIDSAADVAAAAGVSINDIAGGLPRMWRHCWRKKSDTVEIAQLVAFFGGDTGRVSQALASFGFLEATGTGWRVRGAERYLRVSEGKSKGGHAAKGNLIPGARQKKALGILSAASGQSTGQTLGSTNEPPSSDPTSIEPPPPPAEERKAAEAVKPEELFAAIQVVRVEAGLSQEPKRPKRFDAWATSKQVRQTSLDAIRSAYATYARDGTIRAKGHPTAVFIEPGVWDTRLPRVEETGPPPAPCTECHDVAQLHNVTAGAALCPACWQSWFDFVSRPGSKGSFTEEFAAWRQKRSDADAA
jgi:hypothetical protein